MILQNHFSDFTNLDPCNPNPCQSDGTCFSRIDDYNCLCKKGFTGKSCEESKYDK